ncbi:hypothetical protein FGG08_005567 [Glutinoglossum americanum]|uniref:Uncharacterized protein n=1 Tax=Glutinoglossum americanum TaxID=1670608 RepID=A0A9P8I580_9PEZI|nr:hypothetical protein FGG08_005567 [Glutinoglossum americanum]
MDAESTSSFNIQFYPEQDGAAFHLKNEPGQLQRPHIIDDLCSGLLLQVDLRDVVHGKLSENGSPGSLIIIHFRFHGADGNRRFRKVQAKIRFADEKKPLFEDPEVLAMWPDGDFTLSETELVIKDTKAAEVGAGGGAAGVKLGFKGNWERQTEKKQSDRATLIGAKRIEERNFGKKNVVRLSLQENPSQKKGVISEVRTAVLLKRKDDTDRFVAHVEAHAEADVLYAAERRLRKIWAKTLETDPIIFDARLPPTRSDMDNNNLESVDLESQCDILSTTIISTIRDHTT